MLAFTPGAYSNITNRKFDGEEMRGKRRKEREMRNIGWLLGLEQLLIHCGKRDQYNICLLH